MEVQHYTGNVDSRGLVYGVSEKNQDSLGNWLGIIHAILSWRIWLRSALVQKI